MNISKQEIEVFGKAYTLINMSFFLISENFLIEYINDYALENIHLNHSYIGQKFNKLIGDNKLPPILDANELTHDPVIINNKMRKWDKLAIWIENKPFYILLDRAYDDSKATTYDNLVHDIENVIGHKFKKDLPLEQYLKEIGNYFTEIIKKVPCYIYWKNTNLEYIGCNDMVANLFHYKSTNEIFGKTDYDLSPERSLSESYRDDDKKIISEGKSLLNIPGKLKTPEGKVLDTLVSKVPIISLNGQVIGLVGITIDVTELNQARIAAEAGERAKDEIIANFSHDMRTPLSGIITTAYELKDDDISEEKRKELAVQLADSGEVLLEMFQKILEDVAADHMTENDIELETFDINLLVDKLIKLEKPSLTQKGLKFLSQIDPNIPQFLISDRRKIHHIILNLIGNAIKFTKQGHIELRIELLEKQNDQSQITLKFHVIDTGIGVPEESKKHLFERFFKASSSHKAEYKGFGLGLHIAQTYTHLLGGTISFESTEGVGSDFYAVLTLKIANENEIATYNKKLAEKPSLLTINTEMESKPVPKQKPVSSIKTTETQPIPGAPHVLIIEDNLMLRKTTVRLVKKAMLNVTAVDDGLPALELAKTQHFDLILSDVGLLTMSGTEFTQKLRAFEKENNRPPVPIIGVTAHAADGRGECLSAGMNAVTQKPFLKKTLMEILKQFLPNYKLPHS